MTTIGHHGLLLSEQSAPSNFWAVQSYSTSDGDVAAGLTQRLGWSFSVSGGSLSCNALRVIIAVTGGGNENVRIHRNSDDVLIAEATIVPVNNTWVSASVTPFTLVNGVSYTVSSRAATFSRSVRRNNTRTLMAGLSSIQNVSGTTDARPASPTANTYQFCDFGFL